MSFGLRDASEYIKKHSALMLDDRATNCHCCDKQITPDENGRSKLAASRFEYRKDGEINERRALLCVRCYAKQTKLSFNTLEELVEHLRTKQRLPRIVTKPYKTAALEPGATVEEPAAKKPAKKRGLSLQNIDREFLVDLHRMLGEYLALGTTHVEAPEAEIGAPPPEDDEDIFAGMNDEQRARMDAAVRIAAERTKHVPQEQRPNSEVPSGW